LNRNPGDEESGQLVAHASEGLGGRGATKQEHGGDDDVRSKPKEEEDEVRGLASAGTSDLAHGVGRGRHVLEADGKDAKEEDMDGGPERIPDE
jgi:hypothetical protein